MNVSRTDLIEANTKAGIPISQSELIWTNLESAHLASGKARFTAANVLYYIGALIVIGAMGWFITKAWDLLDGSGVFFIATAYIAFFVFAGMYLWRKPTLKIPAGLLISIAVSLVPLATYGVEKWTGLWPAKNPGGYHNFHPYINASWIIMEISTVVAGLIALRVWRFPFITAPIAYALWYMSMDLADLIVHDHYRDRDYLTMVFGLIMLFITYFADLKSRFNDLSFWGYLFGLAAFWGGLSSMHSDSELSKFIYCLINLGLIFLSVVLRRKAFIVFGAMGLFGYLYHLANRVFKDSLFFPFALSFFGLLIIYGGLQFQKNQRKIHAWFNNHILPHTRRLVPDRALSG